MKQIWAPWRMEYIKSVKSEECIFCTLPKSDGDEKNLILFKGPLCFIILNRYPYNSGHLMVSPYRHLACVTLLDKPELAEMNELSLKCVEILREVNSPEGFNLGINLGKSGGAGFEEHIHTHVVPSWNGDTNFMPVLAETKVHPEHINATHRKFLPYFQKIKL